MFLWISMFLSILINHSSIQVKPEVVILQGNGGQLTSPGYPSNYPNNVNDTWIIKTDDKRANVTFYIQEMDIEKTPGFPCDDYIEITEKDPCCFGLFKRCGNFSGHIMARGREIRVSFISDWILTRKGFSLYWKASSTSKAKATDPVSTTVHSTLRTTTVFKKRSVTTRSKLPTTISTTTLGTSTKMTSTPLLDMSTSTLSKTFKMTNKSTPSRMSAKIETISLFNFKALATSTKANAKITPPHSNPPTLSSLMTRNAFNSATNLIANKEISRSRTYPLQETKQALTIPVRNLTMASHLSKTSKTVIRQPSKTFITFTIQSIIPQPAFTQLPSKPPLTVTKQPSKTRVTGQQSTTLYMSRTDTSNRTTSTVHLSISIPGLSISLLALLFCLVIYKRKRRKRSSNAACIHTHGFLSGHELRLYRTMQTRLQMKDFREYTID